ncbi:cytochrome P450 [Rhodococcus sp. 14-2483-1-2]|uniref:cytochrome P450 n=1 Tax=Rhodococcus sp. 14-2483-1-2 TaxID=2023147 RepID=UPI0014822AB8|nr:cytochrome P450 [Rhodococcus sp. 14-2483-1-2]
MTHTSTPLPRIEGYTTSIDDVKALGRSSPLAISDRGYEILGYEAAHLALNSDKFDKASTFKARLDDIGITEGSPSRSDWEVLMPATDGQLRTRLRVMYAGMMRPAQVARFGDRVRGLVAGVFDELGDRQSVDAMEEIVWRIPSRMYCDLVSAPYSLAPTAARLSESTQGPLMTRDTSRRQEAIDALYETYALVEEHISKRRENLGDDFTSHMIRQEIDGKLTEREMLLNAVGLLLASIDNTVHQMGIAIGTLLQRRDVWQQLVADPSLIPAAVEEAIRLAPRLNTLLRMTAEDVEVEGHVLDAGKIVFVSIASAQRDPAVLEAPDEFRLDRKGYRALQFGGGNFNCLGQHLARLEMQETVRALVTRYPNAHLRHDLKITSYPHGNEVERLDIALV